MCQKDTKDTYRDCGSSLKREFKTRSSAGADQGFVVVYTGGEDQRKTTVEFICDPGMDRTKLVSAPTLEAPTKTYNFQWQTKHACPVGKADDNGDGGDGDGGDSGPAISGGWIFIILYLLLPPSLKIPSSLSFFRVAGFGTCNTL